MTRRSALTADELEGLRWECVRQCRAARRRELPGRETNPLRIVVPLARDMPTVTSAAPAGPGGVIATIAVAVTLTTSAPAAPIHTFVLAAKCFPEMVIHVPPATVPEAGVTAAACMRMSWKSMPAVVADAVTRTSAPVFWLQPFVVGQWGPP